MENSEESRRLEELRRLAAGAGHDLNNMLTAILGCSGQLLDSLPEGHPGREQAADIREAAKRCGKIVRLLLEASGPAR